MFPQELFSVTEILALLISLYILGTFIVHILNFQWMDDFQNRIYAEAVLLFVPHSEADEDVEYLTIAFI